ncbi:MAG TPA: hypothetical protein VLL05_01770 [Terriglobales bacterium]|nr:hypothetical protein [Terriglobales bacterium]
MAFLFDAMAAALLVLGWFAPKAGDRWIHPIEKSLARFSQRKALAVVSLGVATILIRLALLPVSPIPAPAIHDEFSYLLGADTFAHGRLTNPPHAMWQFFDTFHVLQHPTYASKYPPGPGASMAIGQLLGHPWFGVLLSTAAMVMAMTWMLQSWVPPAWAFLGGVLVLLRLGLLNTWFDNYYSTGLAAAGAALVLGAFPRILKSTRTLDSLLLGAGAVLLACTRPFEGLLFCLPIGIVLAICFLRRPKAARAALLCDLAPAVVVLAAGCAFLAYYNARVTGSAFVFPWSLYLRQYFNSPIFVWQKPGLPLHYSNPQFEEFFNHWQHDRYTFIRNAWMKHASGTCWAWW